MKLTKLRLRNVGVVKDLTVDFTKFKESSTVALSGTNGAGKSTALNMIPEVLYLTSPGPSSFADLTPEGGEVVLDFESRGARYTARLESKSRPGKPPKVSAYLNSDTGGIESTSGKQGDYKEAMAKLCPPYRTYVASSFTAQDGVKDILHMTDGEAKGLLSDLLELDKLDAAAKAARQSLARNTDRLTIIKNMLSVPCDDGEDELRERLLLIDGDLQNSEKALRCAGRSLVRIDDELEGARQKTSNLHNDKLVIDSEIASIAKQDSMLAAIDAEDRRSIERSAKALAELEVNKAALGDLSIKKNLSCNAVSEANLRMRDAEMALEAARERHTEATKRKAIAADKQKQLTKLEQQLDKLRSDLVEAQLKIKSNTVCDESVSRDCPLANMAYRHVDDLVSGIAEQEVTIKYHAEQIKHLGMHELPDLERYINEAQRCKERCDELAKAVACRDLLIAKIDSGQSAAGEIEEIKRRVETRGAERERLKKDAVKARRRQEWIITEIEAEASVMTPLMATKERLAEAKEEAASAKERLLVEQAEIKARLDGIARDKARDESLQQELAQNNDDIEDDREVVKLLGPSGIRVLLLEESVSTIAELTNQLLSFCYGDRFSLEIKTQADRADKKGTKEVLQFSVLDSKVGREGLIESFCGGEKVFLKEALSLALAIYAARRSGEQVQDLVRDECCGALAEEHRLPYLTMLQTAINIGNFAVCLFVTHDPALKAEADCLLEVGSDAG